MRADVTDGGSRSDTPLHWAAGAGHASLCSILLENGVDLGRCNSEGGSKARVAAERFCGIRDVGDVLKVGQEILHAHGPADNAQLSVPGRLHVFRRAFDETLPKPVTILATFTVAGVETSVHLVWCHTCATLCGAAASTTVSKQK